MSQKNSIDARSECDLQRIERFLESYHFQLDDRELVEHLDSCDSCRRNMENQAAEAEFRSLASRLLQPTDFDVAGAVSCSAATTHDRPSTNSASVQEALDALAPTDEPHHLGRIGTYEITGVIGIGAMGVVLKAIDPSLDRVVALKIMAPRLANNQSARKRFLREAKAAAAVLHPNVIPIHSVSSDSDIPFLTMSYIRGGSLQKRLQDEDQLPLIEILRIGGQIAAGLEAAHQQGLVHRDIKPENILLEEGVERVTITDFGLARAVDDISVTQHGTIAGTPQYMSPEQARAETVDQASDLFSLGSVLYTLCAGRAPFRGDSSHGVMRKIIEEEPKPIRELNPEIPPWLCDIISKLMAKGKTNRFSSAQEVHVLLETCLSHVQQPDIVKLPETLQTVSRSLKKSKYPLLIGFSTLMTISLLLFWFSGGLALLFQNPTANQESNSSPASPKSTQVSQPDIDGHQARTEPNEVAADPAGDSSKGKSDRGQTKTEPLTWKSLLGDDAPESYPTEPLSLISGLNKSRGSWGFAGQLQREKEKSEFEADLQIHGGFKKQIVTDGSPFWQIGIRWPKREPTHTWNLVLLILPEADDLKLMLMSSFVENGTAPESGHRRMFDGSWNEETRTLTWTPKVMRLPGKADAKPVPKDEELGREFKMVIKENGEIQIHDFQQAESLQISGRAATRIGEPYVGESLNLLQLPKGYEIFFASRFEVSLVDEDGAYVAGPRIEKIGSDGNVIYGLITQRAGIDKPEDALGYFWMDSTTGKIHKGMKLGDWQDALKHNGVEEPHLLAPEKVGPKY